MGVRWIDGSSCNVQLKDEMTAKNALFKRCSEAAQDQAREKGLEQFGLNWLEALPYKKKKSDDYGAKGTKGSMFVRLATVQDVTHKGTDRPLVQSSTLAGQALAVQANDGGGGDGGGGGGDSTGGVDKQALARAGAASWNQLMSSHSQNKKNQRTKKKKKGQRWSRGCRKPWRRRCSHARCRVRQVCALELEQLQQHCINIYNTQGSHNNSYPSLFA